MRKFSWILALFVALTMVFVGIGCDNGTTSKTPGKVGDKCPWGCGEIEAECACEEVTFFDLQVYFAELGLEAGETDYKKLFDEISICGADDNGTQVDYLLIANGNNLDLRFTTKQNWAGIDLMNKGMMFRPGDKLTVKGKSVSGGKVYLNTNNNSAVPLQGWEETYEAGDAFDKTFTLTEDDVAAAKINAYVPGYRIRGADANKTYLIEQITLVGLRGSNIEIPPDPVCSCEDEDCACDCDDDCGPTCPKCPVKEVAAVITAVNANTATHDNFSHPYFLNASTSGSLGGGNTSINNGVVTFKDGGALIYRYPETDTFKFADYDFVDVAFTLSNVNTANSGAHANTAKIMFKQYLSSTAYGGISQYQDLKTIATGTGGTGTIRFNVTGAGTSGGFSIQLNHFDIVAGDTFDVTITKVTFVKGTKYTLSFDSDGGNAITAIQVTEDTPVGTLPIPTKSGFTFLGWFLGDTEITALTVATDALFGGGKTLTAKWQEGDLEAFVDIATGNGTLFIPATNWNATAEKYTYDSKQWWVLHRNTAYSAADTWVATNSANGATAFTSAVYGNAGGSGTLSRIGYEMPANLNLYGDITITYDLINILGTAKMMIRANSDNGGGNGSSIGGAPITLEEGTNKTLKFTVADFLTSKGDGKYINIIYNDDAANQLSIIRITKVELEPAVPCECCNDTGTCLNSATCDGDCCCSDCLYSCEGCEPDLPPETVLTAFDDIKFTGWGDLGSVGGNVTFTMKRTNYGCNASYAIPAMYLAYDKVEVTYTIARLAGETGVAPMKLCFADQLKDNWTAVDEKFQADRSDDGEYTFTEELSWLTTGTLTVKHNDGGALADDGNFTLVITKIRFFFD